ncbi:MAG TPA: hypothetical protein VNU48_12315 [Burkholderiaceae bacterium]|nr:hypothetical protein [Burkholderiaceae bacterium]
MNSNNLMTVGAVGFAGFALWWITRKPGGAVTTQPAQQQRDIGLNSWNDLLTGQAALGTSAGFYSADQLANLFK